jgi:hypothetical protein
VNHSIWKEQSDHVNELFAAMSVAFGASRNAPRTCVSHFAKRDKSGQPIPDYADLATIFDTIRQPLSENGLTITQSFAPFSDEGALMLVTTIGHKSGQFQRSYLPLKGNIEPQKLAAAATYLKRIALCAIVGIAADDDDDGATANRVSVEAAVNEESQFERIGCDKLRASKTTADRNAVLTRAKQRVIEGTLTQAALSRMEKLAADLEGKTPAAAPKTTQKQEPALAPA